MAEILGGGARDRSLPKLLDGRSAKKPVARIDLEHHETRFEDDRPSLRRPQPTRGGPNASCTIRPVLSVVAPHVEMVVTDEFASLALRVRIGFGGEVQRRDVPTF
jgi:hypothetical protein